MGLSQPITLHLGKPHYVPGLNGDDRVHAWSRHSTPCVLTVGGVRRPSLSLTEADNPVQFLSRHTSVLHPLRPSCIVLALTAAGESRILNMASRHMVRRSVPQTTPSTSQTNREVFGSAAMASRRSGRTLMCVSCTRDWYNVAITAASVAFASRIVTRVSGAILRVCVSLMLAFLSPRARRP